MIRIVAWSVTAEDPFMYRRHNDPYASAREPSARLHVEFIGDESEIAAFSRKLRDAMGGRDEAASEHEGPRRLTSK